MTFFKPSRSKLEIFPYRLKSKANKIMSTGRLYEPGTELFDLHVEPGLLKTFKGFERIRKYSFDRNVGQPKRLIVSS